MRKNDNRKNNNRKTAPTKNRWRIKSEQDGGMELYHNSAYYHFGDVLPKLPSHLFKRFRDSGYIEVADSREVEQ